MKIAVLGFGFYQWHETPEFCTAICHTPMNDVYRQTLYANPYEASVDKWGNEVKKAIKHKLYKIVGEMTFTRRQPRREARREE